MIIVLLKRIILLYMFLYIPHSLSHSVLPPTIYREPDSAISFFLKNNNEKLSYALGVSLGNYINESCEKQDQMGVKLNKSKLLLGIQDAILNQIKLSNEEISIILKRLEKQLKIHEMQKSNKNIQENLIKGKLYMKDFSHIKGVKKTSTGLLYIIKKQGYGENITDNTKITVHYKGTLINGIEFDNSYIRGKPISFLLKDVILGWQEGLKYIKKGGKIKLIIPPHLAYGEIGTNNIPGNSTIIFDIDLLDIKN